MPLDARHPLQLELSQACILGLFFASLLKEEGNIISVYGKQNLKPS